jgi:hypothetical protein
MEVFGKIPDDAPLVVAEWVWQSSHHILHGLISHRGPKDGFMRRWQLVFVLSLHHSFQHPITAGEGDSE